MNKIKTIPFYELASDYKINIESISHINPYDFNEVHKHNYYEIFVFEKGGGYQQIDFNRIPIQDNSCYIVKPGQLHLVRRDAKADGWLIQFTETMILPDVFLNPLSILKPILSSEIIFEQNRDLAQEIINLIRSISLLRDKKSYFFKQKTVHLLSNLLYSLEELSTNLIGSDNRSENDVLIFKFIELVELHLNSISIKEYARELNVSSKKLGFLIRNQFNTTPLKYVHRILLIAIKRDLVFKKISNKEIAYNYNFDSPSNFSIFIKKHTGKTPSELKESLKII